MTLPSGEVIRVRGRGVPSPAVVAALGELTAVARASMPGPEDGAPELYSRLDGARAACGLLWRGVAREAGVRPSTLFRLGQGRMPGAEDLAALTAWFNREETEDAD